ncbi:MAG: penicillin-binding protein 1A [Candidatus Hydrogenedentota bacterium]
MAAVPHSSDSSEDIPKRRGCGGIFFLFMLFVAAGVGAGMGLFVFVLEDARATIAMLDDFRPKEGSRVYSADGELVGEFTAEARQLVPLNEMPLHLPKAFMATEDDRFYQHRGVRPGAIASAALHIMRTGRLRGGSTITQQLVRNVEVTGVSTERTLARKIEEAIIALQLEREYTKDEILELYLNQIFLGISAHGVEAAAQQYFGKSCRDLTIAQSALLAGLTRSPNNNQPFRHPENALRFRNIVLGQMLENGFITEEEYETALEERLEDVLDDPDSPATGGGRSTERHYAPYFVEEVRQYLRRDLGLGVEEVFEQGLEVHTSLDTRLQRAAENALLPALDEFDERKREQLAAQGSEDEFTPVSGAMIVLDNRPGHEGKVRAMVGGRDFDRQKYNTVTQGRRLSGSAIKPFVWTAALDAAENGSGYTAATRLVDEPFVRYDAAGNRWAPRNFTRDFKGPVTLRQALEDSINIISIKLTEQFGMPVVRSYLERAGITTSIEDRVGLTIALGTPSVKVQDMAVAYSTFANEGMRYEPLLLTEIKDRDGFTRYQTSPTGEEAFKEDVAYLMTYLMQGVAERGTGARTSALDRPRAGKTGTSNNNVDVWFCGYTPQFTSVVWVGYREESRRLGSGANYTGGRVAAPIWTDFMIKAHEGLPEHDFRVPEGVEFHDIDRQTGQAGGSFREAFIRDTEPLPSQPRREEPEEAPGEGEFEFRSISAEDMIRDEF